MKLKLLRKAFEMSPTSEKPVCLPCIPKRSFCLGVVKHSWPHFIQPSKEGVLAFRATQPSKEGVLAFRATQPSWKCNQVLPGPSDVRCIFVIFSISPEPTSRNPEFFKAHYAHTPYSHHRGRAASKATMELYYFQIAVVHPVPADL